MKTIIGRTARDRSDRTQGGGVITALRVVGKDGELRLSPQERSWTLGSKKDAVDLHVTSRNPPEDANQEELVSSTNAMLIRRGNSLWIQDTHSANGIIFATGHKEDEGSVSPGGTFIVGGPRGVKLIALDEYLVVLRKELQWVIGRHAHAALDDAVETIARGTSLLLTGERGCDQRDLARQIHFSSPRREGRFVELAPTASETDALALIRDADGGTLYLDLIATTKPLPRVALAAINEPRIRWIIAVASPGQFEERFSQGARRPSEIRIPPLRERPEDIPALLNTLFVRDGSQIGIERIGEAKLAKLMRHDWPDNIDGLRHDKKRLHALAQHDGVVKRAAEALGVARQSLTDALARLGL